MRKKILKTVLAIFLLSSVMVSPVSAQTFEEQAGNPDDLTTGLAILLVGILGVLTVATVVLNSPVALLGQAGSMTFLVLALVGLTSVRLFYIVAGVHGLALAASGVFKE